MQKHTKIYFQAFNHDPCDFLPCEVCGKKAVDIHHIDNKGMGGSKLKDYIENLMALCRECHEKAHNEIFTKSFLKQIHHETIANSTGTKGT